MVVFVWCSRPPATSIGHCSRKRLLLHYRAIEMREPKFFIHINCAPIFIYTSNVPVSNFMVSEKDQTESP